MNKPILLCAAALLLPLPAAADSRVQSAAAGSAVSATASVNFKIVIPTVLSMRLGDGTAAVMSNGRKALLQHARCASVAPDAGRILCTASMP